MTATVITGAALRRLAVQVGRDRTPTRWSTAVMRVEVDIKKGSCSLLQSQVERIGSEPEDLYTPADLPWMITMPSASSTAPLVTIDLRQRGDAPGEQFGPLFFKCWRPGAELVALEAARTGDALDGVAMLVNLVTAVGMDIYPMMSEPDNHEAAMERVHEMLVSGVPPEWIK